MPKITSCLLIALSLLFTSTAPPAAASSVLTVRGQRMVDPAGRVVVLSGVNITPMAKNSPFLPFLGSDGQPDLSKLDPLPGLGVNTLRLVFIWEAYEPEPGQYKEEYLASLARIVDAAWAKGMYTEIDFHQDHFSHYAGIGCGTGFPYWAVPKNHRKAPKTSDQCGWLWAPKQLLSPSLHMSFKHFFDGSDGVRAAYLKVIGRLGAYFRSRPGVIGYDLLNEPFGDEKSELMPLYEDAAKALRAEDPSAIIFMEPALMKSTDTDLPKPRIENLVYAPHTYDFLTMGTRYWNPAMKNWFLGSGFARAKGKADEWGVPFMVGEFGVYPDTKNVRPYMDFHNELFDADFTSFLQWNYGTEWNSKDKDGWNHEDLSIVDDKGNLRANFRMRPFASRISGAPLQQQSHIRKNGRFEKYEFTWTHDAAAGETEIFVPGETLGNPALLVLTSGDVSCAIDLASSKLRCKAPTNGEKSLSLLLRGPRAKH